jgi:hypothetical protein
MDLQTTRPARSGTMKHASSAAGTLPNPNAMIIIVESGVVRDILPTGPVEAVVIDLDMIENTDPVEQRLLKAVMPLDAEAALRHGDLMRLAACLVREYRRPGRTEPPTTPDGERAA